MQDFYLTTGRNPATAQRSRSPIIGPLPLEHLHENRFRHCVWQVSFEQLSQHDQVICPGQAIADLRHT
jgi:hypothetical protein